MVNVRGSGDHEIERTPPGLSPAADKGCCKPSPFARDRSVDGQRIERGLDHTEPLQPPGPLVLRAGDEDAEVQFGERCGADRAFELTWAFCADEDGGIEENSHLFGEEIRDLGGKLGEIVVERLRRGRVPHAL
jgi:hypothetical protein